MATRLAYFARSNPHMLFTAICSVTVISAAVCASA